MSNLTSIVKQFLTSQEQVTKALDEAIANGHLHLIEVADVVGVGDRHARRYTDGEVALKGHQLVTLALIEYSRGGHKLLSLIIPEGTRLVVNDSTDVNGRIEDEHIRAVRNTSDATTSFNEGDLDAAELHANSLHAEADRMLKEIERKRKEQVRS